MVAQLDGAESHQAPRWVAARKVVFHICRSSGALAHPTAAAAAVRKATLCDPHHRYFDAPRIVSLHGEGPIWPRDEGLPMRNLFKVALAGMMTSLFAITFWGQVGVVASALARGKPETYAAPANAYMPIQRLEPVY